jgi:hypothetical protein
VEGRGIAFMSSLHVEGACDIRSPICTVAEDAIEESRRWRGPSMKCNAGGGAKWLMSYTEVG